MNIAIELQGKHPLLMHNPRMVDPEHPIVREIASITPKRKKTEDDLGRVADLEMVGGLYTEDHGEGPVVVVPSQNVRKCLIETGKITRSGKNVSRALSFNALNVPLIYDGPRDIDELRADPRFRSRLPVVIGMKRVMRVRPQFYPWALRVEGVFLEDAGLNYEDLERIVELAGRVEGIGDNRVNGYGRFTGKVVRT